MIFNQLWVLGRVMSEKIIPIRQLKKPDYAIGRPCVLTLYYPAFVDDNGQTQTHNATITVENGDWQATLDAIREQGGAYESEPKNGKLWLFPWPPTAISLHALDPKTREPIAMTGE